MLVMEVFFLYSPESLIALARQIIIIEGVKKCVHVLLIRVQTEIFSSTMWLFSSRLIVAEDVRLGSVIVKYINTKYIGQIKENVGTEIVVFF